jgi:hypothetical protein
VVIQAPYGAVGLGTVYVQLQNLFPNAFSLTFDKMPCILLPKAQPLLPIQTQLLELFLIPGLRLLA